MKFTFHKERRKTGLAGIGYPNPPTAIKRGGKQVGEIRGPCWHSKDQFWRIRFFVRQLPGDGDQWVTLDHWVTLAKKCNSEPEARQFVRSNCDFIQKKYNLIEIE